MENEPRIQSAFVDFWKYLDYFFRGYLGVYVVSKCSYHDNLRDTKTKSFMSDFIVDLEQPFCNRAFLAFQFDIKHRMTQLTFT